MTITKALTETTVLLEPKMEKHDKKKISSASHRIGALPHFRAAPVPPTFKFVPTPLRRCNLDF